MDLVIHESDCPALCGKEPGIHFRGDGLAMYQESCHGNCPDHCTHDGHTCTCSAPTAEQLRELVEAAEIVRRKVLTLGLEDWAPADRLDAALEPFREKK